MTSPKSARDDLPARLDQAQRRHRKHLRKFEHATRALQVRTGKLVENEARIAIAVTDGHSDPVATYRARHIRIRMADPLPSSADMRVTEKQHVIDIHVIPGAVEMIVGNGIGLTLPVASAPEAPAFAPDPPVVVLQSEPTNGQIDLRM